MRFGSLKLRSLYKSSSLITLARELTRNKLYLVVYRRLGGTEGALKEQGLNFFSMEKEMKIIKWEQVFCTPQYSVIS